MHVQHSKANVWILLTESGRLLCKMMIWMARFPQTSCTVNTNTAITCEDKFKQYVCIHTHCTPGPPLRDFIGEGIIFATAKLLLFRTFDRHGVDDVATQALQGQLRSKSHCINGLVILLKTCVCKITDIACTITDIACKITDNAHKITDNGVPHFFVHSMRLHRLVSHSCRIEAYRYPFAHSIKASKVDPHGKIAAWGPHELIACDF